MSTESARARAIDPDTADPASRNTTSDGVQADSTATPTDPKGETVKTEASTSTTATAADGLEPERTRTDVPAADKARTVDGTDHADTTDGDKRPATTEGAHASTGSDAIDRVATDSDTATHGKESATDKATHRSHDDPDAPHGSQAESGATHTAHAESDAPRATQGGIAAPHTTRADTGATRDSQAATGTSGDSGTATRGETVATTGDPRGASTGRTEAARASESKTDTAQAVDSAAGKGASTAAHTADDPAVETKGAHASATAEGEGAHTATALGGARAAQSTDAKGTARPATAEQAPGENETIPPLFDDPTVDQLRTRWREVQGSFVDSPRQAVSRADDLVAELIQQLAAAYTARKQALADKAPGEADTEALRQTLRHYRALFDQLLSPVG
ncbi:hypothetical protein ACTD5D_07670 [Nocardia takedensis]|uniref:hypothetical protein n=1 Tax=Nocardia takedensis TaxID=259390 RepID=UPI0002F6AED4|nr:hypothetical protein [Nocardia takedensis]